MSYLFLLIFVLVFIITWGAYYYSSHKFIIWISFGFIFPFLVLFIRTYNQPDFENYKIIYNSILYSDAFLNYLTSIEVGFLAILNMLGYFGINYEEVSNIIFVFICFLFSYSASVHRESVKGEAYLLAFLLFSSYYFYFLSLNVVRQGLAIAFLAVGFSKVNSCKRNHIIFFILAALFHYSSVLISILIFSACKVSHKISFKTCLKLVCISFLVGILDLVNNIPFPDLIADRINKLRYYSESDLSSYFKLIFYLMVYLYYIVQINLTKKFSKTIFFCSSAYLSFVLAFMYYGEFLDRLMMYSLIFSAFIMIDIFRGFKPRYLSSLVLFVYCSVSYSLVMLSSSLKAFFE